MRSTTSMILGFAAFMLLFNLIGWPDSGRTLWTARTFVTLSWTMDDSWGPMADAAQHLIDFPRDGRLYQQIFFTENIKFQYPPTSLFLPYFFPSTFAGDYPLLRGLSWLATMVVIGCAILIFFRVRRESGGQERWDRALGIGGLAALGLMFYPVTYSHVVGQIQTFITAMFALMFYFWLRDWKVPAGVMLGLMCLIKPQYALIVLWGLARRSWGFAGSAIAVGTAGLVASVSLFGVQNHLGYLSVLRFLSRNGEAYYPNQSMNGLLNRLLQNGDALVFQTSSFPPFSPFVYYPSLLFAALLVVSAIVLPLRWNRAGSAFDLAAISLAATMASPIAWEHHYGVLLPIFAFLFAHLIKQHAQVGNLRAGLGILMVSYLLSSTYLFGTASLAHLPLGTLLMSSLFFGALLVLGTIYFLMSRSDSAVLS